MLKKTLTKMLKSSAILGLLLLCATFGLLLAQDKLSQGIEAYNSGKYDQAIQLLSEFIASNPNEPDAYFHLGNAYFKKGDFKQAISSYLKALEKKPKDPELLFQLGMAHYNNKEYPMALDIFDRGLKLKKQPARFHYGLALVQMAQKDFSSADLNLRKALLLEPNSAEYHRALGDVNSARQVYGSAIEAYKKALEIDSSRYETHYSLARAYFLEKNFNSAINSYKKVIKLKPDYPQAHLELANIYFLANKHADARLAYEEYLKFDSTNSLVFLNLGRIYYHFRQYSKAIENLNRSAQLNPKSYETHLFLGNSYLDSARLAQDTLERKTLYLLAQKEYSNYLKVLKDSKPDYQWTNKDAEFWLKNGIANFNVGDSSALIEAEKSLLKAIELDPNQTEAYSYLGNIYYKFQKFDEALVWFNKKVEKDPTNYNGYLNLAYCYLGMNQQDKALESFKKSLELKPDNKDVRHRLAYIYIDQLKDFASAKEQYEQILKLDSTDCDAKGFLGFSLLMLKKSADAVPYLNSAVVCAPKNVQFHLWLAQAFALSGQKSKAKQWYNKVLLLDPRNADAKKGLELLEL